MCGVPGTQTTPHLCAEDIDGLGAPRCSPLGPSNTLGYCTYGGGGTTSRCSEHTWWDCTFDIDCPTGETCQYANNSCLLNDGLLGETLSTNLSITNDLAKPAFGALLCPSFMTNSGGGEATGSNSALGLPGPMRLQLTTELSVAD